MYFHCLELPKPVLKGGLVGGDPDPKKRLFPTEDFIEFQRGDANYYMWDNYFTDVSEENEVRGTIEYRGQR